MTDRVRRFRCPGCSADLVFAPKDGVLECPYCGRKEQIPESPDKVVERSYEEYLVVKPESLSRLSEQAQDISCTGCGMTVTFQPPDMAGECPFCAAKMVADAKASDAGIAPEGALPFKVVAKEASQAVKSWLASRWFAPSALNALARQDKLNGIYLPFWTYDAHTTSHYTGERGEYYYETETYYETDNQGNQVQRTRQVRHTRWYSAEGTVTRWFDDVLVAATKGLPRNRLGALEPWDLPEVKPYDPAYLSGFKAQRYQVDLLQGFEMAKEQMAPLIRTDIRQDIDGDEQRIHNVATHYSGVTFKYLLLPVWISAYRFQNKVYQVMVNARTGEVQGDRPYSAWKIAGAVAAALLVILIILLLRGN